MWQPLPAGLLATCVTSRSNRYRRYFWVSCNSRLIQQVAAFHILRVLSEDRLLLAARRSEGGSVADLVCEGVNVFTHSEVMGPRICDPRVACCASASRVVAFSSGSAEARLLLQTAASQLESREPRLLNFNWSGVLLGASTAGKRPLLVLSPFENLPLKQLGPVCVVPLNILG